MERNYSYVNSEGFFKKNKDSKKKQTEENQHQTDAPQLLHRHRCHQGGIKIVSLMIEAGERVVGGSYLNNSFRC
jgi:hypothetical protein